MAEQRSTQFYTNFILFLIIQLKFNQYCFFLYSKSALSADTFSSYYTVNSIGQQIKSVMNREI